MSESDSREGAAPSPTPTDAARVDPDPGPLELGSRSDVGRVRSANEDSCGHFLRADGTRLLVVADGMGGHRGGATASRTAVATIAESFEASREPDPEQLMGAAVRDANARIFELAQTDPELEGMGTTVVALLIDPRRRVTVAHVGDSRAYVHRHGRLRPLTTDHSVVAEMQRRGLISSDEAAVHPRRNEILRSVGVLPEVEVELKSVVGSAGDRFLLCSDGLSGLVSDEEMASVVEAQPPVEAVDALIEMANERGGPDNVTVQILKLPAGEDGDDPEDTAPVSLSQAGIETIESGRRSRRSDRRPWIGLGVGLGLVALYALWRLASGGEPEAPPSAPPPPADRFETAPPAPRRGIPR